VPPSLPSLPTNRVFVVQLRARPPGASSPYDGRGEHLVSGQVGRFHSLEELLAFMCRVLTEVSQECPWGAGHTRSMVMDPTTVFCPHISRAPPEAT